MDDGGLVLTLVDISKAFLINWGNQSIPKESLNLPITHAGSRSAEGLHEYFSQQAS